MEKFTQVPERQIAELTDILERLRARLEGISSLEAASEIRDLYAELELVVARLQVIPLSGLASEWNALVQDLAARLGKKAELQMSGLSIDVPPGVREVLSEILVHGIRNALDHGIEEPGERLQAGKPSAGKVQLVLSLSRSRLELLISDDGRGVDPAKIARRALEKGLIKKGEAASWTWDQVLSLLFEPGFSTREDATDVSGRGVGMDAIRALAEELSGSVALRSKPAKGFETVITLPLGTVALEAIPVKLGSAMFWIPAECVERKAVAKRDQSCAATIAEKLELQVAQAKMATLHFKSQSRESLILSVDWIGQKQYRLFRRLDASWIQAGARAGSSWIGSWLRINEGEALATRSFLPEAEHSPVEILADEDSLRRVIQAATS